VTKYLYARGQHVTFTAKRFIGPASTGAFVITRLLPSGGGEARYEIRSTGETYSRAVLESDLSAPFEISQPTDL